MYALQSEYESRSKGRLLDSIEKLVLADWEVTTPLQREGRCPSRFDEA